MVSVAELKEILANEYGIVSEDELQDAFMKGGIDIAVFTTKAGDIQKEEIA